MANVWASIGRGRKRLMLKEQAEAEGYEYETIQERPVADWIPEPNTYRLSTSEREKLYNQTGVHFDDYAGYKRWQRETGHRDLEPGEEAYEKKDVLREWAMSGARGECPVGRHGLQTSSYRPRSRLDDYIAWRKANGRREA